ncbi:protein-disulfide reductase DsbD family protein [Gilvimarinus polysaccharolyticus]|uniref:protein-disulfide reductase DsbD family protein n=1 Tax=Gilvimarinus polysaccharolyticus TaxID=863921 RepID=UPI0006738C9C|nr:protein-disulfide reductase DsbD domain-containing protein [Gilvimarinus polysaccharolyticus]
MIRRWLKPVMLFALLLGVACQSAGATTEASGDHVKVRLLVPSQFASDQSTTVGFYFEVDPHWHVYWQNAGDSGAAPRFDITSKGAHSGAIKWPFPTRLNIEHLTNLGYQGNVAYLFEITPEAGASTVELEVNLEWLVCKVDCIPGFGQIKGAWPVADTTQWAEPDKALLDTFNARVPQAGANSPWQPNSLTATTDSASLSITGKGVAPEVFPLNGDWLGAQQPRVSQTNSGYTLRFVTQPGVSAPKTSGFVIAQEGRAWQFDSVPLNPVAPPTTAAGNSALWLLLLAAFAGGVILNLMPCVFPVLSIKVFSLMQPGVSRAERIREGLLYSAGVLTTFTLLGALLLILRAGGSAIGWGFQLQSAPVVLALAVLFWLMALSFSGVFEFGHRLMNLAGGSRGGAFATGVLAVFIAAPCTGPFMGAALGAAAVLPTLQALAIFIGLGAGLAAPFLLLSASPALLKRLPKPGPWMDTLRQLFAFPLYATVIWLLWVLGKLVGDIGWVLGTSLLLALAFTLWLARDAGRIRSLLAIVIALVAIVTAGTAIMQAEAPAPQTTSELWQSYDKTAIAEARAQGRAVFIDYTAAWCITCQVNKKLVLETDHTRALFTRHNVLAIRADWTRFDPEITAALEALGRNSLPVYAWYPAGAQQAQLLPQLLQERMINKLFDSE